MMHDSPHPADDRDDRDDRSLRPLPEDRLEEVKGGALNAYMHLTGETQGEIHGDSSQ